MVRANDVSKDKEGGKDQQPWLETYDCEASESRGLPAPRKGMGAERSILGPSTQAILPEDSGGRATVVCFWRHVILIITIIHVDFSK